MSVLKSKRGISKMEYVATANKITQLTLQFLLRLSQKHRNLLGESTTKLTFEVLDNAAKAERIYPADEVKRNLREEYLLKARAALSALDVRLSYIYNFLLQYPEGSMIKKNGEDREAYEVAQKIDKMALTLGELIDREDGLLEAVLAKTKETKKGK